MSDIEVAEDALESNMAEPIPDVLGAVEAGRPVDPEMPRFVQQPEARLEGLGVNDDSQLRHHRVRFLQDTDRYSWTAPGNERNQQEAEKKTMDKFTQTFFKYMKNLSDKRFQQIINMEVNHEDKEVIFYRPSCNEFSLEEFRSFRHH